MDSSTHKSFQADDRSYYAILKKDIHKAVAEAGFNEKRTAEADIIVAELTSNLNKHAQGGEILFRIAQTKNGACAEIICIDNGPGIADLRKVLSDGYSSLNTLGHGLGSIRRLADEFDMYSQKGWGTIVIARVYENAPQNVKRGMQVRCYSLIVPKKGETVSGDGYYQEFTRTGFRLLVADGLGHGEEAHHAVNEAVKAFRTYPSDNAVEILRHLHTSVRKTRGLVATVLIYNQDKQQWNTAGVGNITAKLFDGILNKQYLSYNGIVGHNIPNTMNEHVFKAEKSQYFICCSDGLRSRWDPLKYPMIHKHDPLISAAALYKDFGRQTDDMSVVITKLM